MKVQAPTDMSILELLVQLAPESSNAKRRSWLKEGRVTVDGERVLRADYLVKQGQEAELSRKHTYAEGGLRILFEDRALIVIDKPEGLLSVSTDYQKSETAHAFLKERYGASNVHVVHRIDRETSGVMLFARTAEAREYLKDLLEAHDLEREYRAIVEGTLESDEGAWESFLLEGADYTVRSSSPKKGRRALTHYRVLGRRGAYTYIQLHLETGRKHQIRVHCQDAGHPVVGDRRYGSTRNPIKRLCLHAHRIAFIHPLTGKKVEFSSPVPSEMERLVKKR